jgi:hypothetical protein
MIKTTCAQCGSDRVHRSQCRHILERIATVLGGSMTRCHDCNSRYLKWGGSLFRVTNLQRVSGRLVLAIAMVAAAIVVMLSILWLSRTESNPSGDTGRLGNPITYRGTAG